VKRIALLACCLMLAACAGGEHEDLRQWMTENTRGLRGNVPPLPAVKPYQPVPYEVEDQVDPFRATKIEPDSKYRLDGNKGGRFQPDYDARERRNSELERYPLESISMIGRLHINNRPMAVVKYDGNVRQVKVGDYLGLDFGMVTEISENEVKLRELIQDSAGDWDERHSTLHLQTTEGSSK
jgi:type IV pilus assembly protein PilP